MRCSILAFRIFVFVTLAVVSTIAQTVEKKEPESVPVTDAERQRIEQVVRDYLLKNPSLLREMIARLDAQEEGDNRESRVKKLSDNREALYADTSAPIGGNPKGDVSLIVFFDYNCGYCRANMPAIQNVIAKDKMLRVIYKEFPILGASSEAAAHAALAAGRQGKYQQFHDALFGLKGVTDAQIKVVATRLGLNYVTLKSDMASTAIKNSVGRNLTLADALGIDGTPSYIIGDSIISGVVDPDRLIELIASERAKLAKPPTAKAAGDPKD